MVTPQTPTPRREPPYEPLTLSGERLRNHLVMGGWDDADAVEAVILVEAEAAETLRSELEEAVGGLPVRNDINWADDEPIVPFVELRAVIQLIHDKQGSPEEER